MLMLDDAQIWNENIGKKTNFMVANMDQTNNSQVQIIRINHARVAKTEEMNPLASILAK